MAKFTKLSGSIDAAKLISANPFYLGVEPEDLAGTDIYGMVDDDLTLVACVVIVRMGAQAYMDYLCVRPEDEGKGLSVRMVNAVLDDLRKYKVRRITACVNGENGVAMKLAKHLGAKIGWPYVSVAKDLEG